MPQKRLIEQDFAGFSKKFKHEKTMEGSTSQPQESSMDYVIMPWDDNIKIYFSEVNSLGETVTIVMTRWELIKKQLDTVNTPILDVEMLIDVIKSYNVVYNKEGKLLRPPWKFLMLRQYLDSMDDNERTEFFQDYGVLSAIRDLSQELIHRVPQLKILKSGCKMSVTLHQRQIAALLANAFMCTFPMRETDCPSINFNTLFEGSVNSMARYIEKIKCIVHYFKRVKMKDPVGVVSFNRLHIQDQKVPRWDKTTANLCHLEVRTDGKIEEQEGFLQMDFANRYVGGGVLGRGCVQEEIRFIICPELIVARLFTECLADNEALLVKGAERYSRYKGYSDSFQFDGDYLDLTPLDETSHRKTHVIVLDALSFHHPSDQYRESRILRELKKAYVGFRPIEEPMLPLATGNWGCGAFRGDPQLKSVLQLMASSQARRDMLYLTFGDIALKNQIDHLYRLLKEHDVNVGMLYKIIRMFNKEKRKNQTVFEFIQEAVLKFQDVPIAPSASTLDNFVQRKPSAKSESIPDLRFRQDTDFDLAEKAGTSKIRGEICKSSKTKTIDKRLSELGMDFNFEKKVKRHSVSDFQSNSEKLNKEEMELLRMYSDTKDSMWFENETATGLCVKENPKKEDKWTTCLGKSEDRQVWELGKADLKQEIMQNEDERMIDKTEDGRRDSPSLFSDSEDPAEDKFKEPTFPASYIDSPSLFSDSDNCSGEHARASSKKKCSLSSQDEIASGSTDNYKDDVLSSVQKSDDQRTAVLRVNSDKVTNTEKKWHQIKITDCFVKK